MPYTTQEDRKKYKFLLQMLDNVFIDNPADLSFLITQLMRRYMKYNGCPGYYSGWSMYSDILKALDAARDAFMEDVYRPHEAKKRESNGPVF